ncbi:hypothetical protein BBF96_02710 [Anoxybacter fermentans]|uniref:Uncharacterized protein n=1 Tax=Anoxybacter fermentans TaxID=1323375 RepID=A0A3S9SVU4_9FIRM|nr:hypothetical protein [Anoxybacter fermentans]AZR72398.1 hypothetical protein BBF96_02710 [Anoxybacter fermentans]
MLLSEKLSDAEVRQLISLIAHICMSREFQALKEELAQYYCEAGYNNFDITAFEDALYTMLQQMEEFNPSVKELL